MLGARTKVMVPLFALVLAWMNAYVVRDAFFIEHSAHMNSMHGFWMALARLADQHWFTPTWWPYWDCGMPFEFTYAPLVPGLTAIWSKLGGVSIPRAFHGLSAVVYVLTPVSLFLCAWRLSAAPVASFAASALYSLLAVTEWIAPDNGFALHNIGNPRRVYLQFVWDETPHFAALSFLPFVILFLVRSYETRKPVYYFLSVLSVAVVVLANAFGATMIFLSAGCLLLAYGRDGVWARVLATVAIGLVSYLLIGPWLPPSLLHSMSEAGKANDPRVWAAGTFTSASLLFIGLWTANRYLPLSKFPAVYRFCAFFSIVTTAIVSADFYLKRALLPQPGRYKVEMEIALCVLVAFSLLGFASRIPPGLRAGLTLLLVSLAAEQIVSHRRYAKDVLRSKDIETTIEHRIARAVRQHGGGGSRVMLAGSMAQWHNTFEDTQQYSGGSWSTAYNMVQQIGWNALYSTDPSIESKEARALLWMKAFGVQLIGIPGPKSPEFWKPLAHPEAFQSAPAVWEESDTRLVTVPRRSASLAHVVPEDALVRVRPRSTSQIDQIRRYVAALDDPALPLAQFRWTGTNQAQIDAAIGDTKQRISVQVNYHEGWKALVDGREAAIRSDSLGLMVIDAGRTGPVTVNLAYDGGLVLRMLRWVSAATMIMLLLASIALAIRGLLLRQVW